MSALASLGIQFPDHIKNVKKKNQTNHDNHNKINLLFSCSVALGTDVGVAHQLHSPKNGEEPQFLFFEKA